ERVKEAAVIQDGDMLRAIIVPQEDWARNLTDEEVEETLKREVLEPYNLTVTNYKKLMSLFVYRGELPRTKLEKLQRFKLKDILKDKETGKQGEEETGTQVDAEPTFEEYFILKTYIEEEKEVQLRPTDHIETDLAFDSLDMVALQGFIQQTFGTTVNAADMPGFKNIQALAEHIAYNKTRMEVKIEDWHAFLHTDSSALQLPRGNFGMPLLLKSSYLFFKAYNRLQIKGSENIPANGPLIIAPNHQSFVDGAVLAAGLPMKILNDSYFYATEEHVKGSFRKAYANHSNIILMERGNLRDSILKLAEVLKRGKNVIIFPEGSRSRTGKLTDFKKTFAILSQELQVPILPVCIKGAFEALPRTKSFLSPHKIEVTFLKPVTPGEDSTYADLANQVKQEISLTLNS
nr:1-acyl-sn-glycerol-3-phosphate acyltransferase [Prevotella sp.]